MDPKEPANSDSTAGTGPEDQEISERLQKLKEGRNVTSTSTTDDDIKSRLQSIKGETPSSSDAEIYARLAKLKGVPVQVVTAKVTYRYVFFYLNQVFLSPFNLCISIFYLFFLYIYT